ncbi:hypothetical protein [Streptomyces sp. NPDC016845]|uniref:hypothetical protein n=1 Tax=Streptomyces sp. NPDC016845 TaxID=3364972 RepID=UPI003790E7CF
MTPHERLAAEDIPTGTFGHALPPRPTDAHTRPGPTWTPIQQAQHRADLAQALEGWAWNEETRADERRHLHLIDNDTETNAA